MLFTFKDSRIVESSGMETSVLHPKIVYTHNDSGDTSRFFAVGPNGKTRAVYTLNGAGSWDWEDMASGPNKTLWLCDIGANQLGRDSIAVYKVHEPKKVVTENIPWTRYNFVYDDGQSHNAEGCMVNPNTGALYIVSKVTTGGSIYEAPRHLSTTRNNVLRRVASAPDTITAADFSKNGKTFVLRSYGQAYFYKKVGGRVLTQVRLPEAGESICYARSGPGLLVGKEGQHSPVWRILVHR